MTKHRFSVDQLPVISDYARKRVRPSTEFFRLKKKCIVFDVDKVKFSSNDPRNEDVDWTHVEELANNLKEAGYDENATLAALYMAFGELTILDHHHLILALQLIGVKKFYGDLYEYIGDDSDYMEAAATDFGFEINNNQNSVKKTSMKSVIRAGKLRIKKYGYIWRKGTPNNDIHVDMWLRSCKHHHRFSKGKLTEIKKAILDHDTLVFKKIRNVSTDTVRNEILASTSGQYGSGQLNDAPDGTSRYGFVVCTDNVGADAPKWWNQIINTLDDNAPTIPVIQTYSKKDDPKEVVNNYVKGLKGLYKQFIKSVKIVNKCYPLTKLTLLSEKEFAEQIKFEYKAFGQLSGEYNSEEGEEIITRYINLSDKRPE